MRSFLPSCKKSLCLYCCCFFLILITFVFSFVSYTSRSLVLPWPHHLNSEIALPPSLEDPYESNTTLNLPPQMTIVSAYFPLKKSKHSAGEYEHWMLNLLRTEAPMVLYTTPEYVTKLQSIRNSSLPTQYILFDDIWQIPVMEQLQDTYTTQWENLDPEKSYHSPALYAVWNSKAWMVGNAIRTTNYSTPLFGWVDIGCFRETESVGHLFHWPYQPYLQEIFQQPSNSSLVMLQIRSQDLKAQYLKIKDWQSHQNIGPFVGDFIGGTAFFGTSAALLEYETEFYRIHDEYLAGGYFVGKDQTLMNSIVLRHPEKYRVLFSLADSQLDQGCGDPWFYFIRWLARTNELPMGYHCPREPAIPVIESLQRMSEK